MKKIVFLLFISIFLYKGVGYVEADYTGWHTNGSKICTPSGSEIVLKSINWFGFETSNKILHGLWCRNLQEMLNEIKDLGFNSLRIPFSNDILLANVFPNGIDYSKNPELEGLTAVQALDYVIDEIAKRDMYVILDRHCSTSNQQTALWYTNTVSEEKWIEDWVFLAKRYKKNPNVIAVDLHNEPHGRASWGTGDETTDWKAAAERAGNAILAANKHVFIIVEGIEKDCNNNSYWWGGALDQVLDHPVELNVPNKVVYSPHDYGPGVYQQSWFNHNSFPENLQGIWDERWGYIAKANIAPIWIGEFGGRQVRLDTNEGRWQNKLVDYIKKEGLHFSYWCWNPNSGDTGGLLNDDWHSLNQEKVEMLTKILS